MLEIARDRRKASKKGKEKRKMRKSQTTTNIIFTSAFLYRKEYILLNIVRKTWLILLHLYCTFFMWKVMALLSRGNAVITQQRPYRYVLVL